MRLSLFVVWTVLLSLTLGCSGGKGASPTTPEHPGTDGPAPVGTEPTEGFWGAYEFSMSPSGQPELVPAERQSQLIVDPYVRVTLLNTVFDPETRIWDIDAEFTNLTPFTGFGLWVVFYNLNGNTILDQDGFATLENGGDRPAYPGAGQRKPVIAVGKEEERRPFLGNSTLQRHVRIQWPEGATNFNGLRFYLDAAFPFARQEPIVENLFVQDDLPNGEQIVSAFVKDWQTNPAPLEVVIDPNGPAPVLYPMNDAGIAPDTTAGDDTWTGTAPTASPTGRFTVRAFDAGGFHFENDILADPGPCNPTDPTLVSIADGSSSTILVSEQVVVSNQGQWEGLWAAHAPGTEPPPVNFECRNVYAVFMGERPSSGYAVAPGAAWSSSLLPELNYVTVSPGERCGVDHVITSPFRMWTGPKRESIAWRNNPRIAMCEQGNLLWYTLFKGTVPAPADNFGEQELVISDPESFDYFWAHGGFEGPAPFVDFGRETVLATSQGLRETTGHEACIDTVNAVPPPAPGEPIDFLDVDWSAIRPGEGCHTEPFLNLPWHVAVTPKVPGAEFGRTDRAAEPCGGSDCRDFDVIREAQIHAKPGPYELLITNLPQFEEYWAQAFPETPRPPVNFEALNVVAIGTEFFSTGGHTMRIDCIRTGPTEEGPVGLHVDYTHIAPHASCPTPDVVTNLALVAVTPKTEADSNPRFHRRDLVGEECGTGECLNHLNLVPAPPNFGAGPYQLLINGPDQFEEFWHSQFPNDPPVPNINFEEFSVLAAAADNRGDALEYECARIIEEPLARVLEVTYTHLHTGANCPPRENRWFLIQRIPKFEGPVSWVVNEVVEPDCPPTGECNEPFETLIAAQNNTLFGDDPYAFLINDLPTYEERWFQAFGELPRPPVNFETQTVVALSLQQFTSGGHRFELECIERGFEGRHIARSLHNAPGENCPVEGVLTKPTQWVVVAKMTGEIAHEVETLFDPPCPEPECLPLRVLSDDPQSGPAEFGANWFWTPNDFVPYWIERYPEVPIPGVEWEQENVVAINMGTPDVPGQPIIDCVETPVGPNELLRVFWHKQIWSDMSCARDGNNAIVAAVPIDWRGAVEFIRGDDTVVECPPPPPDCFPMDVLTDSPQPPNFEPHQRWFWNPNEFVPYWMEHYPGQPIPPINFEQVNALVINTRNFDAHTVPVVDCVRFTEDPGFFLVVDWHQVIEVGEPCNELPDGALVVLVPITWEGEVLFNESDPLFLPCERP